MNIFIVGNKFIPQFYAVTVLAVYIGILQ